MKKIIVATDFSSAASNAANYAVDMALAIKADILLFHVYQLPISYSEIPIAMHNEDIKQDAEMSLSLLKEELLLKVEGKLKIDSEIRIGAFFTELKAICDRERPFTVVMGCQGTTAASRLFFGGHSVYAMRHLTWPLITVPQGVSYSKIRKIGLVCDFEKLMNTIPVEEIKMLMHDFSAELHVFNAAKTKQFEPETVFGAGLLQELLGKVKPQYHFFAHGNTDEAIMEAAEANDIDLLIVFPKHHSLIDKLMHRSHTKQLVLHSHVPVMALHQ